MADNQSEIVFHISGRDFPVPELRLGILRKVRKEIISLGPDQDFIEYAETVVTIMGKVLGMDQAAIDTIMENMTMEDVRTVSSTMTEWLRVSGFLVGAPEETQTAMANPGTGTSTELSPNLLPEGSAEATGTGSNDPTLSNVISQ